jgi:hypothetical protein
MPKQCKECNNPVWARGLCLYHDRLANTHKHELKRKPTSNDNTKKDVIPTSKLKRSYIKPISDKQKKRLVEYNKLRLQYLNEHPKCEVQLSSECSVYATEIHHKCSRDGDNLFKHFVATCRNCHTYIHDKLSLEEGIELGLLMRKSSK